MDNQNNVKQRIYQCALELFAEHGYDGTSIRHIANKACTTVPTIYYYFTNKEQLFTTILKNGIEDLENSVIVKSNLPAPQRLQSSIVGFLSFCTQNRNMTALIFQTWFCPGSHYQSIPSMVQVYNNIVKTLDDILVDGIKNGHFRSHQHEELAQNILGILTNYIARMLVGKENIDPVRCGETTIEFIMKGINI
jgi:AcrR family transcriptional regulator